MVSLSWYLGVGALLFAIGVVGIFLNRRNLIVLLMAIELMLLAVNMNFVGDPGHPVPQPVDDQRRRARPAERLSG